MIKVRITYFTSDVDFRIPYGEQQASFLFKYCDKKFIATMDERTHAQLIHADLPDDKTAQQFLNDVYVNTFIASSSTSDERYSRVALEDMFKRAKEFIQGFSFDRCVNIQPDSQDVSWPGTEILIVKD